MPPRSPLAWLTAISITSGLMPRSASPGDESSPQIVQSPRRRISHGGVAQKLDKNADYILALKGNQGTLREDVELFAAEQRA
jgi:hypothetical protein